MYLPELVRVSEINIWANPPWILIPRILSKLIREKATMTLIVPLWETAPWFPLLLEVLIEPPILFRQEDIIIQDNQESPFRNPK